MIRETSERRTFSFLFAVILSIVCVCPVSARIILVDDSAQGSNTGGDWTNAFPDLQTALDEAQAGDDIWVAGGTYRPTVSTDRHTSFVLKEGVAVLGGFAGTEDPGTFNPADRDPSANATTLSGDIGISGINDDNVYHVVIMTADSLLDGSTVFGGNADGPWPDNCGGGVLNLDGARSILSRCIIVDNRADYGGGIFLDNADDAVIEDCRIEGNYASLSGGGMFAADFISAPADKITLTNNLIIHNHAGHNGGGIAAIQSVRLEMSFCTIAENDACNDSQSCEGTGGGIYSYDYGQIEVVNSILWDNRAKEGKQITVANEFDYRPKPGTAIVSFCLIPGISNPSEVQADEGCELIVGQGILSGDQINPWFVSGSQGDFYLSQFSATQDKQSPCVDAGSGLASEFGMDHFTTRSDGGLNTYDKERVDMGHHYPLTHGVADCQICDLPSNRRDGKVNLVDLAAFSQRWLNHCAYPGWCDGADLDHNGIVEIDNLAQLVDCWMTADYLAPRPNPAEWGTRRETIPVPGGEPGQTMVRVVSGKPSAIAGVPDQIIMTAKSATDNWDWEVAYQFECVKINNHSASIKSPWLYYPAGVDPTWFVIGLQEGTTYTYVCRVAEIRVPGTLAEAGIVVNPNGSTVINANYVKPVQPYNSNWTADSVPAAATSGYESIPPTPIAWEIQPYQTGANSVSMKAVTASDAHPPVSYIFMRYLNADDPIPDKTVGPQQTRTWIDTDVQVGQTWTYSFVAVDNLGNTSDPAPRVTITITPLDLNPPLPNPMTWQIPPVRCNIHGQWYDYMQVVVAVDPEGTVVQYQVVENYTGYQSPWQVETNVPFVPVGLDPAGFTGLSFWIPAGGEFTTRWYQCRARDSSPNQNATAWSAPALHPVQ